MITQSLHSRFSSHMREMFRKRPADWLQTCLYRHLTKAPHPLWYPSQASGIPWRSRTSAEERGCLNQGLKNNWTLWTSFHAIPHLLPLLLSDDLCYIFTCRLPQWIWWCTKQINLPCYYSCIYCVYGKSFLCVYFLPSMLCFNIVVLTKLSQKYMEHFPPILSWFISIAWIAKCEWPVLGWILFVWVLPHHSPPPHSQLWAPCTEHDEVL